MKRIVLACGLFVHTMTIAQINTEKNVWLVNDYQIGVSATNVLHNESMMGTTHNTGYHVHFKLGAIHVRQFTLGLQLGYGGMRVGNSEFYGDFDYTKTQSVSPYVSMYIPLKNENQLEPYISYEYIDYKSKHLSKEMDFDSNGLSLGLDFNYKFGTISYLTFGLKYSMQTMNIQTHPEWETFMNKHNYISAKIAVTFAKYR